jgi:sulfite exporter TauE/SafE
MLAFGLGTVPLLWLVQANYGRLKLRLTPVTLTRLQAGLALATALVITWRLRVGGPTMENFICH